MHLIGKVTKSFRNIGNNEDKLDFTGHFCPSSPLIDGGIYMAGWSGKHFLSAINYPCKDFDKGKTLSLTKTFFSISEVEHKLF